VEKGKEVKCPSCGEFFELEEDVEAGDVTYCVDCDQEFTVIKVHPPKLKPLAVADEVKEDLSHTAAYEDDENELPGPEEELHEDDEAYEPVYVDDVEIDEELVAGSEDDFEDERE